MARYNNVAKQGSVVLEYIAAVGLPEEKEKLPL